VSEELVQEANMLLMSVTLDVFKLSKLVILDRLVLHEKASFKDVNLLNLTLGNIISLQDVPPKIIEVTL
jgi:hypothetical protein